MSEIANSGVTNVKINCEQTGICKDSQAMVVLVHFFHNDNKNKIIILSLSFTY